MPWSDDASVQSLRLKYNAALAAHQSCARALAEAASAGTSTEAMAANEARARFALECARAALYSAMAKALQAVDAAE